MSVSGTGYSVSITGNGSTTNIAVTYPFQGTGSTSELTVVERTISTGAEVTKTYTTDYTVTGGSGSTGTVIAGTAPADTVEWHVRRNTSTTQTTDYVTNDPFAADTLERDLDRLTMAGQERDGDISQSFKFPDTYTGGAAVTMPEPVASAYLLFNSAGNALTTSTTSAGQHLGSNGTVSLPFYSFSSDPDSGFYRIGANNIGLTLNGAKVVDYNTSGMNGPIGATTAATGAFTTLAASGTGAITGVLTMGGDVVSDTDSTDSLGTSGVRWLKAWVDSIQTTANIDVGADLIIAGNLTVNGTTVTNDATNTVIKDPLIELNSGAGSNANDLGLIMERGSTGNNAVILWDESGDFFTVGTTTATASSTGNMTYSFAPFKCSTLTATAGTLAGMTSIGMSAGATLTAGFLDEDAMGSNSAVAGVTQQSVKAYVDNNAPENGVKFAFESTTTDADQGVGKVWLNHSTPSSATVLYIDDVEAGSVSVNAWVDTWDDVTNAVARGMIYIASYGATNAILVYKVTGAVTSASTYSKVAVTHVLTVGTISDGDAIGLTFIPAGEDGDVPDAASATASGIVELATSAEVTTGTDSVRAITPAGLHAGLAGLTDATITAGDSIIFADSDDSNNLKEDTVQGIIDLAGGSNIVLTNAQQTFTKSQVPSTYSGTALTLDYDTYTNFIITLSAGANTLAAPSTEASQIGQCGTILFIQPSSGSAGTVSLHSDYETAAAAGLTLSSANNDYDVVPYLIKADNSILLGTAQLNFG